MTFDRQLLQWYSQQDELRNRIITCNVGILLSTAFTLLLQLVVGEEIGAHVREYNLHIAHFQIISVLPTDRRSGK